MCRVYEVIHCQQEWVATNIGRLPPGAFSTQVRTGEGLRQPPTVLHPCWCVTNAP